MPAGGHLSDPYGGRQCVLSSLHRCHHPAQAKPVRRNRRILQPAFHELTHSTGHSKRLNRLSETAFFGSEAYSKEELIAEIGAAALVNHVGLETSHSLRNSAAYIQNWLAVLKNDKRFIVSASGKADKAISLILGC